MGLVTLNSSRARRAMKALKTFAPKLRVDKSTLEEDITDLITDLLHLCKEKSLDTDKMIDRCKNHFNFEGGSL